jgi:predicted ATPase
MITEIELRNFKSHTHSKLNLNKINIFIGKNNTGKSSIGEALKIIKQFNIKCSLTHGPLINKPGEEIIDYINKGENNNTDKKNKAQIVVKGKIKWDWYSEPDENNHNHFELNMEIGEMKRFSTTTLEICKNFYLKYHNESDSRSSHSFGNLYFEDIKLKDRPKIIIQQEKKHYSCSSKAIISNTRNDTIIKFLKDKANLSKDQLIPLCESLFQILKSIYIFQEMNEKPKSHYNFERAYIKNAIFIENTTFSEIFSNAIYEKNKMIQISKYIKDIFNNDNLDFDVEHLEDYKIKPIIKRKNTPFNLVNEGSGFQQILFQLLRNEYLPNNSTLFINEPECYIDVDTQHLLVEYLINQSQRKNSQLILSTHSEHIIYGLMDLIKKNIVSRDDVSIWHFKLKNTQFPQTEVRKIPISPNGDISDMLEFFDIAEKEVQISLKSIKNAK